MFEEIVFGISILATQNPGMISLTRGPRAHRARAHCTMQTHFLEEDLAYFRCVLKNQKYNVFDFFFKKREILKSGIGLPSFL